MKSGGVQCYGRGLGERRSDKRVGCDGVRFIDRSSTTFDWVEL